MLISLDKFLKGSRNEGNICQLFDSLCKHIQPSAKSEEAIDQEETVSAGVFSPEQMTRTRGQRVCETAA